MIAIYELNEIPALPYSVQPVVELVVRTAITAGLQDSTCILVIEAGDGEQAVAQELGWNPLYNPIDGVRYDEKGFVPYWSWLENHGGWYRLVHTVGNDGFAYELLIEASGDGPFYAMCRGVRGDAVVR